MSCSFFYVPQNACSGGKISQQYIMKDIGRLAIENAQSYPHAQNDAADLPSGRGRRALSPMTPQSLRSHFRNRVT